VYHDKLPITGFRIQNLVYITDMKTMDDSELPFVMNPDILVVNALRFKPDHHSHQNVDDAVNFARRVGAKRTFLTHMCHDIGLHEEVNRMLPPDIQLAYDGEEVKS
jgi:phosphoribosyl 1,2-cyclic phosphate phosphodiesterase